MREIKFRVWSKDENKMYINVPSQIMEFKGNTFKPHSFWGNDDIETHAIPMQFTGLLDKNSVEIYEGDIVMIVHNYVDSCSLEVMQKHYKTEVKYNKFYFSLSNYPLDSWDKELEVIGNIYENTELLEIQ